MDLDDRDIEMLVLKHVDERPCAIRLTHLPTGVSVEVDDQATLAANRELALERLKLAVASHR